MEADDQSSDDEVFVGEVTDREKRHHPTSNSRRRTTLYFPGISRPDSSISVFKEITDDGTLIFSCEDMEPTDIKRSAVSHGDLSDKNSGSQNNILNLTPETIVSEKCDSSKWARATTWGAATGSCHHGQIGVNLMKSNSVSHSQVDHLDDLCVGSESGYSSISDASLTSTSSSSVASPSSLVLGEASETIATAPSEDRKRKRCQTSPPGADTVQPLSPHLLVSSVTKYPDPTGTTALKGHFACGGTLTVPGVATANACHQSNLLQTSESAFSKLQLQSPQLEPKCDFGLKNRASPITKDFPKDKEHDGGDNPCHLISRMKRKIAQRSRPSEFGTVKETENETENYKGISCRLSPPKVKNKSESESQRPHFNSIPAFSESKAVQEIVGNGCDQSSTTEDPTRALSWDKAVSAGGDAQSIRLSKVPQELVPESETLEHVASSASSLSNLILSMKFGAQASQGEGESLPTSQLTAPDACASPNLNKGSVFAERRALTNSSMSNLESVHTPLSRKSRTAFQFHLNQPTPLSPDLFSPSPPTRFRQSSSVRPLQLHAEPATAIPVHSPIPAPSANSKFKSVSISLQPIQEGGVEALNAFNPAVPADPDAVGESETESESQQRESQVSKRAKYPPLRRRSPAAKNKENVDLETSSLIFPSPVFAQGNRAALVSLSITVRLRLRGL